MLDLLPASPEHLILAPPLETDVVVNSCARVEVVIACALATGPLSTSRREQVDIVKEERTGYRETCLRSGRGWGRESGRGARWGRRLPWAEWVGRAPRSQRRRERFEGRPIPAWGIPGASARALRVQTKERSPQDGGRNNATG